MLISQDLFDETLLESQELFEYSDEQAVQETISELQSGRNAAIRLDHLSLTHPNAPKGKKERATQHEFVKSLLQDDKNNLSVAIDLLTHAAEHDKKSLPSFASLVLQHGFLAAATPDAPQRLSLLLLLDNNDDEPDNIAMVLQFILAILPDAIISHPLAREIKLQLSTPLKERWCTLYDQHASLRIPLVQWARVCCNACEDNKKTFVQAAIRYRYDTTKNGLNLLLESLPQTVVSSTSSNTSSSTHEDATLAKEICKLVTIIGKFQVAAEPQPQDGQAPLVSSAHANVKELHRCGAVRSLHSLAKQCTAGGADDDNDEELLCEFLSALRVMAIDNDIVQTMVAVGILETADASLRPTTATSISSAPLATATLGLLRNLCANDEIKSNICKKSLPSILHAMETHPSQAALQEHGCGIFAAMSLRQPNNALAIVEANGIHHILTAMKAFPNKVPLQRQGCLALRNIASRLSVETKQMVLDAGAEDVLKLIAARHQESIDEAYAALRDLGVAAVMHTLNADTGKAQGTQVFGSVKSNFRPCYD